MDFIIGTNNIKKLKELQRILLPLGINAKSPKELNISLKDVEETGSTFEENALLKAKAACELSGLPAIADDSGLCVDALNGEPGIFSARYAGNNATDKSNKEKLLREMDNVTEDERNAHFYCCVCCYFPSGKTIVSEGKCYGKIAFEEIGDSGFGYDPIFIYNGKSFAQISSEEKDKISHRGIALQGFCKKLKDFLEENNCLY